MPIYEYKCDKCGHEYELMQKISDAPITECEKCHQDAAKRLVSAAGFQLKGTGWYATDFKDKGKPKTNQDSNSCASNCASKSENKDSSNKGD